MLSAKWMRLPVLEIRFKEESPENNGFLCCRLSI